MFDDPAPVQIVRWVMAEKFGWTLEYIDSLPVRELFEFLKIEEGRAKANKEMRHKSRGKRR